MILIAMKKFTIGKLCSYPDSIDSIRKSRIFNPTQKFINF